MLMYIYIKEGIFYVCFVIFLLMRKIILLKMYMEFEYDLFKRWFLKIIVVLFISIVVFWNLICISMLYNI